MKLLNILSAARKLIENPNKWTQGALARDAKGNPCVPIGYDALAWDATGAILKVAFPHGETRIARVHVNELLRVLDEESGMLRGSDGQRPLTMLNDYPGHVAVLRVYDAVIAKLAICEHRPDVATCEVCNQPAVELLRS